MDDKQKYELEAVYQRNTLEWFGLRQKFDRDVQYKDGKELLDWKRQEIKELMELLTRQKRELDYFAGEKIEPMVHFAEAVLVGKFGGGI